ncbi:MAG: membrane integrity-associated transporter subunit PqiC [Deltaproteobacteria bacterium]|nr:membrane integrity-associated transporter subunit PqiC [Deltaproteobacteria bacterium]
MDCYKKLFILFLGLPLLFGSCLKLNNPSNKIEFYTLEYDPPQIGNLAPLPHAIRMERFSVAPTYNTNRIIYRDRSFKREAYVYYKWRANPGDLVTYFLARDIKLSGLFKAVLAYDSRFPSSYVLEGSVDEFFEWDTEEIWKAVLNVSITVMEENEPDISQRILFQKTYRTKKSCKQRNPAALAEAMSRAMAEISGKIIKDIYDYLKDRAEVE